MKFKYLITLLLSFIITGCSPINKIYKVDDQTSKNALIEKFNSFSDSKQLNVVLKNDSSFTSFAGTKIINDSLYTVTGINKLENILLRKNIKNIKFFGSALSAPSGYIELNNGSEIKAKDIEFTSDSAVRFLVEAPERRNLSLNVVDKIVYKNRLLGTMPGILGGAAIGAIIGAGINFIVPNKNNTQGYIAIPIGGAIGALLGGAIGYINGYNYTFMFDR